MGPLTSSNFVENLFSYLRDNRNPGLENNWDTFSATHHCPITSMGLERGPQRGAQGFLWFQIQMCQERFWLGFK
jgi:hypothetical protein